MRGDISGRLEFGVALVRGLGGNLNETGREAFAKEIFKWCGESHPGRYVHLKFHFCTYRISYKIYFKDARNFSCILLNHAT